MEPNELEQSEIDAINAVVLTPEQEASIDYAMAHARHPYDHEVAVSAEYDRPHDLLLVVLKTGQRLAIPREDLQDLADADPDLVEKVKIDHPLGMVLDWEELDVCFRVDGLRRGGYGSERWMKRLQQRNCSIANAELTHV